MKSVREPLKINADFSIQKQITKWIKYMSKKKKNLPSNNDLYKTSTKKSTKT